MHHRIVVALMACLLALGCGESASSIICPAGTRLQDGECVAEDPVACGPGTQLEDGECVPEDPAECGPGTLLVDGICTAASAGPRYEVRVAAEEVSADGFAKFPVFAIGTLEDGTPSTEAVLFGVSRTGAGHFPEPILTLTRTGVTNYYTACNTAVFPGCAGPFQVTLALASDPDTIVASSHEIQLVEPMGVGSLAACEGEGNVVFMDGEEGDWIHPWIDTITAGTWSGSVAPEVGPEYVRIGVDPDDDGQGSWWDLQFSTKELGRPIQAQVYQGAQRYPFEDEGHPGLSVSGDGRGCNRLCGRFEIHELEVDGPTLQRFAATFEQNCECGTSTLRGCVVYDARP